MHSKAYLPFFLPLPTAFIFFLTINISQAQFLNRIFKIDTTSANYYETFDTLSNNRLFASQKLTYPTLLNGDKSEKVLYKSNGNLNLGIGHTYKYYTFNIGINFKFINEDDDIRGNTRFLDLHSQIVGRPYIIDFYGQFYYGAYIMPSEGKLPKGVPYEQRPDLFTQLIGFSTSFVPNWRRFSYAAAITQRDWQKKSAGSPLYGLDFFVGKVKGDSSIIPGDKQPFFSNPEVDKIKFVALGVGIGYGYTLVIKKHWFVHGSFVSYLSAGYFRAFEKENVDGDFYLRPNFTIRPSAGYNSNRFNCALYWFANRVTAGSPNLSYQTNTTNLRLTFAYRIRPKAWMHKVYDKLPGPPKF
jgi:hypothetical protein